MRHRRTAAVVLACTGFVLLATGVVAARPPTDGGRLIHQLADRLLYVAIPVTLVTEGFLLYAIWRFRKNDEPTPTRENRRLEITWTVATGVVLLFVGLSAYAVMVHPAVTTTPAEARQVMGSGDPVVVNVTGAQWFWTFEYPGENVSTQDAMVLPAGRQIVMRISSTDVVHSLFVPGLGIKKDAFPGQENYQRTTISSAGVGKSYPVYCTEYCGTGHSDMRATVDVVSTGRFEQWLANQRSGGNATAANSTA